MTSILVNGIPLNSQADALVYEPKLSTTTQSLTFKSGTGKCFLIQSILSQVGPNICDSYSFSTIYLPSLKYYNFGYTLSKAIQLK